MTPNDIITWLRDQAIRAPEDVLKRGMNQAADAIAWLTKEVLLECGKKNQYREELAKLKEQHRWIPVTERLPEPMQHIIAVGRNFPWLESAGPVLDTFVYNPDAYQPWMEYITHWMPWPGFPKEAQ